VTLDAGRRLGPYEILGPLGAGGMGEVYRARDGKLGRDVAIKVLPAAFATDAERLARFRREAQVLAALNHNHIAAIYGLEESGGLEALVLELVPGETLAERLGKGPLPLDEALEIARQIAEALEAAHERGIVHRDLKPTNVKLTPEGKVKVLDFGLAKALTGDASSPDVSTSPTLTAQATQAGIVIGTAAYMSPEQARGKQVDKRADIWAWGCVLYEMLTGKRAFQGETVSDTLAAVLRAEIDWAALPAVTPASVRRVLKRCLDRDTRTRFHDIADVRIEMEEGEEATPVAVSAPRGRWRGPVFFAAGAVLAAAAVLLGNRSPARPGAIRRFELTGLNLLVDSRQGLALSPDGGNLVFRARGDDGFERLYLRALDSLEVRALPGTEQGGLPFFSPDGEWIGFFAAGTLKKVALAGGSSQAICRAGVPGGGTWLPDGTIIFVSDVYAGVTERVSAAGGAPQKILTLDSKQGLTAVTTPWALPGGKAVLCSVRKGETFDVAVFSLDGREWKILAEDGYGPVYQDGFVFYQQGQGNSVLALPFDARTLVAKGSPSPVLSGIGTRISFQTRMFAVAAEGTMAYIPRATRLQNGLLLWVDRKGVATPIVEISRPLDSPRLSPDGTRVAFRTPAPNCDVWVHDLSRGATTRLTLEGDNHGVVWMSDGRRIAFARAHGTVSDVLAGAADGAGHLEPLGKTGMSATFPSSCSPDGRFLLASSSGRETGLDVSLLEIGRDPGDAMMKPLIHTAFDESEATFSPDGRWIAYVSNESGRSEVYLQPFPAMDSRQQVSTDGGTEPVWSRNGKELFFRHGRQMLAAEVRSAPAFSVGRPRLLFEGNYDEGPSVANYDVTADGGRFVMVRGRESGGAEAVVVLNWLGNFRARAGAARGAEGQR
jgi:serine/threonine-protein kinase